MEKYDVIVIGGGNAGLAAAATCAKNGVSTLLLEKNKNTGGSAASFRRGRFEFEAALHELGGVAFEGGSAPTSNIFKALGADIDWRAEENLFRVLVDGEDGYDLTMPAGMEPFCDKMESLFPGCRDKVYAVFDLVDTANKATAYLSSGKADPQVLGTKYADFLRMASHTAAECMDALGIPSEAQAVLNTYWPYIGALPDREDAFHFFYILWLYVVCYPKMPAKKSPELTCALEKVIRDNGGEIWTRSEVKRLLIKDDAVYGVELTNGEEIYADHVISNWFPDLMIQAMQPEVPERALKIANARELGLSFVTIYLGLNRSADELGIKDYSVFWYPTTDTHKVLEKSYGYGGEGWIIANCLNKVIPESSPEGTCTMFFTSAVHGDIWKNVKAEDYHQKKYEVAQRILNTYEEKFGIRVTPFIEEIEIATPVTFARYLNTPNGTPYGYQTSFWDSIMARTMNVKNEIMYKGLRFCGAHAERGDGYSANYANGYFTALAVVKEIKGEDSKRFSHPSAPAQTASSEGEAQAPSNFLKHLDPGKFMTLVPAREGAFAKAPADPLPASYVINDTAKALHPEVQYLKVVKKEVLNPMNTLFELAPNPEKGTERLAWFEPGSVINIPVEFDGIKTSRTFTLASSPRESQEGIYRLILGRIPGGKCSGWLMENWNVGTEVTASAPFGKLTYNPIRDGKTILCLAGGINPYFSMAKAIADGDMDADMILLYEAPNARMILLKDEWDALAAQCDRIKVVYFLTDEEKEGYVHCPLTAESIKKYAPESSWSFLFNGPPFFTPRMIQAAKELGLDAKWIRTEFQGEPFDAAMYPDWPGHRAGDVAETIQITVKNRDKEQTVTAKSRDTIMRALEFAGIAVPAHCRSGECAFCRSKLISGEVYCPPVWEKRREADLQYGYIHPCCTFALSDIVIEIPEG